MSAPQSPPSLPPKRRIRRSAVAVVVVAAGVLVWLLLSGGDDEKSPQSPTPTAASRTKPVQASGAALRKVAKAVGFPIYWAGRVPGRKVEFSQTSAGNIYIRYLTPAAPIGDQRPRYLTIGTYPLADAFGATRNAGRAPGNTMRTLPRGGIAVAGTHATNAYLSYPGSKVQVEVFAPERGRALRLVLSGRIRAIRRG